MTYGIRQIRKVRSILRPETTPKSAAARSVWHTKEWADMQVAIMDALKPHAEAWQAVSKALEEHHLQYAG